MTQSKRSSTASDIEPPLSHRDARHHLDAAGDDEVELARPHGQPPGLKFERWTSRTGGRWLAADGDRPARGQPVLSPMSMLLARHASWDLCRGAARASMPSSTRTGRRRGCAQSVPFRFPSGCELRRRSVQRESQGGTRELYSSRGRPGASCTQILLRRCARAKVEPPKRVPLFSRCSEARVTAACCSRARGDDAEGRKLTQRGASGKEFIVIVEEAMLKAEGDALRSGDFLGEIALVTGTPRTATGATTTRRVCS